MPFVSFHKFHFPSRKSSNCAASKRPRIDDVYEVGPVGGLGRGNFGHVTEARRRDTGDVVAIKTIRKEFGGANKWKINREIDIMRTLAGQENIIELNDTLDDERSFHVAMPKCSGGDLLGRVMEVGHFTEAEAAFVMRQLFSAVAHMHRCGIVHRDFKPENCLFETNDAIEFSTIKIIDFGTSVRFEPEALPLRTEPGLECTPCYVAPEVVNGFYGPASDLWSCGVILYILLSGTMPFDGDSVEDVLREVRRGQVQLCGGLWEGVSEEAKTLVRSLLELDDNIRPTADEALRSAWLVEEPWRKRRERAISVPHVSGVATTGAAAWIPDMSSLVEFASPGALLTSIKAVWNTANLEPTDAVKDCRCRSWQAEVTQEGLVDGFEWRPRWSMRCADEALITQVAVLSL